MQRSRAVTSVLALALILTLIVTPFAFAVTADDLRTHEKAAQDARDAAKAAESRAEKLAAEAKALDETIAAIQGDINALADDIATATERSNRLKAEVDDLTAQVNAKQTEIEATQAEYERQQALLGERMEASYKNGDLIYFELLLDSRSIEDFISRTSLVQRVIESNSQLASDLKDSRITLEKIKAEIERDLETVDAKRAEAEAEEKRLKDLRARHQSKLDAQRSAQDQKEALVAENKANADRLRAQAEAEEAESARIARELYGTGSGYFAGVMAWPVPGFEDEPEGGERFGYRIHPILGYKKLHTGIDIGSLWDIGKSINGATIVAAADGTVIYAGYRGGYGYCTMIDHGNGVVTLYAHQQTGSISVSKGQKVDRRDPIGKVGSTGLSTGPHLHFEVRINGTPVDPMTYLR